MSLQFVMQRSGAWNTSRKWAKRVLSFYCKTKIGLGLFEKSYFGQKVYQNQVLGTLLQKVMKNTWSEEDFLICRKSTLFAKLQSWIFSNEQ